MEKLLRIDRIGLHKLNNAEYTFFSKRTILNITSQGREKLGITKATYDGYNHNNVLINDIVSQSRISNETAKIAEVNARCDDILRYLLGIIDRGRLSPIAADREAYRILYNVTKAYRGITELPQGQQVAQTTGLIFDLSKDENSVYIIQLKLVTVVQELGNANAEFLLLLEKRAQSQVAGELPTGRAVRREMDEQYEEMMLEVVAHNAVTPTPEAKKFIAEQNKLIADTNAAYNRRMAPHDGHKEEGPGDGETELLDDFVPEQQ